MILQDADVNDTGLCRAMKRGSPVAKVQLWKTQVLGSLIGAHLRVKPNSILWAILGTTSFSLCYRNA